MRVIGVAGVVLCAAAMFAAGCSGGRDIVPLETVANAAFKTESVGTARVSFEGIVTFNQPTRSDSSLRDTGSPTGGRAPRR
jgi:hypothetical protein